VRLALLVRQRLALRVEKDVGLAQQRLQVAGGLLRVLRTAGDEQPDALRPHAVEGGQHHHDGRPRQPRRQRALTDARERRGQRAERGDRLEGLDQQRMGHGSSGSAESVGRYPGRGEASTDDGGERVKG
jgi:hypothetical protein